MAWEIPSNWFKTVFVLLQSYFAATVVGLLCFLSSGATENADISVGGPLYNIFMLFVFLVFLIIVALNFTKWSLDD